MRARCQVRLLCTAEVVGGLTRCCQGNTSHSSFSKLDQPQPESLSNINRNLHLLSDLAGLLTTTRLVLSQPLPRIYDDNGTGKVVVVAPEDGGEGTGLIGLDFRGEDLQRISRETVCASRLTSAS